MVLDGQGGHGKTVYSIDIRKDCEMLATASRDYTVRLWNCSSGRLMASLVGHSNFVFKVVMHPSKPICASASHDGTIKFWCTVTGSCLQTHPPTEDLSAQDVDEMGYHSAEVSAVAFHPHRDIMASVSYDMYEAASVFAAGGGWPAWGGKALRSQARRGEQELEMDEADRAHD